MRRLATFSAGFALLTGSVLFAHAANSPLIVWQGSVTVTATTAACDAIGVSTGDLITSVYRPRLVADEPSSAVTFILGRAAHIFYRKTGPDQMTGNGDFTGQFINSRGTSIPNSQTASFTGQYKFTVKPATITAATKSITITGQVNSYFNVSGCTVKFVGAYQPRP